ncbi:MAG: SpoIIE family protein phosphatase [Alphaproteobacteria bacterium]|nr:SpoIIE family protein phosphatase [Alphaproteobacteria bacterium]
MAVIWQPKDVVGGDFYWFGQIGNQHVLVAMDCTGHGVTGAFMTFIAHSALEQICSSQKSSANMGKPDLTAAEILHMLHDGVYRLLHQSQLNRNQNGLDASVVILSEDAQKLNFAGAHMDIYSVTPDAPAIRYKGNKISLGYESADVSELDNIYFDVSRGQIFRCF